MARKDFDFERMTPPHSYEAEMSALGSMMISEQACDGLIFKMKAEDFYAPAHREIFKALSQVRMENRPVDLVTVRTELELRGKLKEIGGPEYLLQISETVPTAANAEHYSDLVLDQSTLRRLEMAGHTLIKLAKDQETDLGEKLSEAEDSVYDVGKRRMGKEFESVRELAHEFFKDVDRLMETGEPIKGLMCGFSDLDRLTGGFRPGTLLILAARPAMGKTSLALNMATNVAVQENGGVAIFSLEMTGVDLVQRMISTMAKVSMGTLRKPNLHNDDYQALADAVEDIYRLPIFIDDSSDMTTGAMRAKCLRLKSKLEQDGGSLKLVVVDYLQLMRGMGKAEKRYQEVGQIARGLKQLSKDVGVPVVALAQFNRAVESRDSKRPTLSDLSESGSIEAEADMVMSIYRDKYYQERSDEDENKPFNPEEGEVAELGILKHRAGPTGKVLLAFQPALTRFSPLDEDSKNEYREMLKARRAKSESF
jgi:replicative DNA helicase